MQDRLLPAELRAEIARGRWSGPTSGLAPGYVQANLVALPAKDAEGFRRFCELNPKPCPVLDVSTPGHFLLGPTAAGADVRTDIPRYCVFRHGELVAEPTDARPYWRDDLVTFLLGCSLTFEAALLAGGVPLRHIEHARLGPAYVSSQRCRPAGRFAGPLVVSMRPVPEVLVDRAIAITARYPQAHGAPVFVDADRLADLGAPDYGEPPVLEPGDVPVFWACGVTSQVAALDAGLDLLITHAPGHMLVTDLRVEDLARATPNGHGNARATTTRRDISDARRPFSSFRSLM